MELTLAEAASAVKKTKQTVLNAINKGRLSASKDANGQWKVDSAELMRAYPAVVQAMDEIGRDKTHLVPPIDAEVRELRARLEAAETIARLAEARANELRRDLDAANERVDILLRALPAGAMAPTSVATVGVASTPSPGGENGPRSAGGVPDGTNAHGDGQTRKKRGFLSRVFGGGGNDGE